MRTLILMTAVLCILTALNGCGAIVVVSGAITTAKSAYDGYETLSAIKKVQAETPTLSKYRSVLVSFDVQPRKGNRDEISRMLEEIYVRNIGEIAEKNGLKVTCKAYDPGSVAPGKEALIVQVREKQPPIWTKVISGDKIHASINFIDRKSSMVITGQKDVSKNYEEMMQRLILSTLAKLDSSGESNRTVWSTAVTYFRDPDESLMTEHERSILRKG